MKEINVKEIIKEIQDDIAAKGYKEEDLHWEDMQEGVDYYFQLPPYDEEDLNDALNYVHNNAEVSWVHPIAGGIKGFIQKVIRRLIKFIVMPIVADQNSFNNMSAAATELLASKVDYQANKLNDYEKKILKLEERIAQLEGEGKKAE